MYNNRSRGFTLIELLVVIDFIGILSAVVLASLSTARSKGSIAAIQSNINAVQTQAEIYYGSNSNSYGSQLWSSAAASACTGGMFSDPTITKALAQADSSNGSGNIDCVANGTSYVVAADLSQLQAPVSPQVGNWWCVDSSGTARQETATAFPTAAISVCP